MDFWQFNDPAAREGMAQAFRRDRCESDALTVNLKALDPSTTYTVTNLDTKRIDNKKGMDLMSEGLHMKATTKPAALVYHYKAQ